MGKIKKFPSRLTQVPGNENRSEQSARERKRRWRKPLRTLLAGFVLFNILAIGYFAIDQQIKLRELESEIGALLQQKENLLSHKEMLTSQLELVEQDEMIEKLAREQLGMIKPGEKILILKE